MPKRRRNHHGREFGEEISSTGSLSDDTLLCIFSHISTRDLLSRLALVCRRWLRVTKSSTVKELVPPILCCYDRPWGSVIEEVILCGLPRLLKNLKRIALPTVFDNVLVELGRFCPKLKELRVEGFSCTVSRTTKEQAVTDRGVIAIAEGCPELEVLSLSCCWKVTDSAVRALAFQCRQLKILHLTSCKNLTDIGVTLLPQQLNCSLWLLDLVGCVKITKGFIVSFSHLAKDRGSSLRVLAISKRLWKSSQEELMKLKIFAPYLSVRVGSCGIPWDGFYHSQSLQV